MTEGSLSEIDFEISSNNYPKDVYEESSEINTGSFETVTSIDSNNFLHKSFENLSECRRGSVDSYLLKEDLNYMSNLQSICGELQRSNDEYSLLSSSTKTLCGERSKAKVLNILMMQRLDGLATEEENYELGNLSKIYKKVSYEILHYNVNIATKQLLQL
ncbi:hypothetical protein SNEBB_002355 [Seison nebaliae]|nr:hypothetical protein SNEBB_002355 [Seison nebaliae]